MNYHDYWMLTKELPEDKELKKLVKYSRCPKCVYEGTCRSFDKGDCTKYKRDPPDGGYYG
jgi:hypothetical protein